MTTTATSPAPRTTDTHRWRWVGSAIIVVLNVVLLTFVGVPWTIQVATAAVMVGATGAGASILHACGLRLADRRARLVCSFSIGLVAFASLLFLLMHRPLLGTTPQLASAVAVVALFGVSWWRVGASRPSLAAIRPPSWRTIVLAAVAVVLATLTTYGHGNSQQGVQVDEVGVANILDVRPTWGFHTDRVVHIEQLVPLTAEEGFPPSRVNHRAVHVVVMAIASATGDVTPATAVAALKASATLLWFMLSLGLTLVAELIFGANRRVATLVGVTALVFSPLKLPLVALSPTYRGFFSASGTFYHSDTQLWATALIGAGLLLLHTALDTRTTPANVPPAFVLGCTVLGGSFFFKPSMFTVVVPALLVTLLVTGRPPFRTWARGMAVVAAVAAAYVAYVVLTPGTSPVDGIVAGQVASGTDDQLGVALSWFDGYVPRVRDRFPEAIRGTPALVLAAMTAMSFAAFWFAWGAAARRMIARLRTARPDRGLLSTRAPEVLAVSVFVLGIGSAVALSTADGKGINFRWAAAAAYPLTLPLFVTWITRIESRSLRLASWAVYALQTAQGIGYLGYFAYRSSLV